MLHSILNLNPRESNAKTKKQKNNKNKKNPAQNRWKNARMYRVQNDLEAYTFIGMLTSELSQSSFQRPRGAEYKNTVKPSTEKEVGGQSLHTIHIQHFYSAQRLRLQQDHGCNLPERDDVCL